MKNCLICTEKNAIKSFEWNDYTVHNCKNCELTFCMDMIQKEELGSSSPVNKAGTEMMENSYYKTFSIATAYAKKRVNEYEKIMKRKCKNILEIGCGPGVFFDPLSKIGINWRGLEINPHWINFGKKNKIPIIQNNISKISDKFDIITAHQVLEHVEDPNSFILELKEKLNPGGLIHFELPNQNSLTSKIRRISEKFSYDYGFIQPPMHLRAYTGKTLRLYFEKYNLEVVKIFTCSNNHKKWGQVRNYTTFQKFFYSMSGFLGAGSLLIGIAKKK